MWWGGVGRKVKKAVSGGFFLCVWLLAWCVYGEREKKKDVCSGARFLGWSYNTNSFQQKLFFGTFGFV